MTTISSLTILYIKVMASRVHNSDSCIEVKMFLIVYVIRFFNAKKTSVIRLHRNYAVAVNAWVYNEAVDRIACKTKTVS